MKDPTPTTHTPGPWNCCSSTYKGLVSGIVRDAANNPIADCRYWEAPESDRRTREQIDADARLIAAAPALYAALKIASRNIRGDVSALSTGKCLKVIRDALAAADGKEQP